VIVRRHNRCVGLTLFRWGRKKLEIWFCPRNEEIEPHRHEHIDSMIYLLAGRMHGRIAEVRGLVELWRGYPVPAGTVHTATTDSPCIFANWETWIGDVPVTSAAEDFTAV